MYTGPHIIKDGLVFGYDTGYGVADNDISTRFYPGQPTTNIVPLSLSDSSWSNEYSSGRTLRSETLFGQPAYEFKSNDGQIWVSPFAFNSYDRSTNDLTLSVYAKNIGSSAVSMNTYFGGDYSSDSLGNGNTKSIPADNTWRRYSWTRFSSAMNANHLEFRTANTGVVISCPQLEIGRVVTPIVNGTRSSTSSLIDLKETADIDVSNVSFDSTGQLDFDGSSDFISLGNFDLRPGFTLEAVVYNHTSSFALWGQGPTAQSRGLHIIATGGSARGFVYGMYGNDCDYPYFPTTNAWHHLVFTYDGASFQKTFFADGIAQSPTLRNVQTEWLEASSNLRVGTNYGSGTSYSKMNGAIAVAKVYNRPLSSSEIKQNFNAYKNRFSI